MTLLAEDLDLEIVPYERIGPIRLGMSIEDIEASLGCRCRQFQPYERGLACGAFTEQNVVQVEYKRPGVCVAVHVGRPAKPHFQGRYLFDFSFRELEVWFRRLDSEISLDCGLTSPKFGIAIYAPFYADSPLEPPEGVMIYERGYYEASYGP
jgi:hypothetical protein